MVRYVVELRVTLKLVDGSAVVVVSMEEDGMLASTCSNIVILYYIRLFSK